ncbi:ABC transporter substrate-binding protein [Marinivivus vitaminiproducens]|uniref:ABC transporter substrate-binding protein n=1 Tax=Marinivivus vitaminiproducens TaxID=3035935 RepID=UPI0027A4138E|nr:ABC transporter substrate-binding protein [Geminicoccaceae bacterium SCSIO 64248]
MGLKALLCGVAGIGLVAGTAQAQEVSGDVVKIGVLSDMSGVYSDVGGPGSVAAARMAVEDFGGTVLGKPIEVVSADHQNKPDIGSSVTRQWIDVDGVDMVTDVPNSGVALAVQGITRETGRIFVMSGPATVELTGKQCSPTGFHWTYDTRALAVGTGKTIVEEGGDSWYFLTADYAFGHTLEADTTQVVEEAGGEVLGGVRHPLATSDFSSFLLQAQGSGAKVIGLANAGGDTINSVKQAAEFGITQAGQQLAGLLIFISDIHSLGLETAQGLTLTTGFYWDLDDQTREWSQRFAEAFDGRMPTMVHAGVYSGTMHYLKAIAEAGTDDGKAVAAKMHEMPVDDFFARNAKILANGHVSHDMYLAKVKAPDQSTADWDYYEIVRTIPGEEVALPVEESGCQLSQ